MIKLRAAFRIASLIALGILLTSCTTVMPQPQASSSAVTAAPQTPVPTASPSPTPSPTAEPTASPTPTPTPEPTPAEVDMLFMGDLMFHKSLVSSARKGEGYDFKSVFEKVSPAIAQADYAIANLEAPVYDPKKSKTGEYQFFAPPEAITDFASAGLDVFTTANNHAMDQGGEGLAYTIDTIRALGLKVTGTWSKPEEQYDICMLEQDGVKIAILAYGRRKLGGIRFPEGMGSNPWEIDEMKAGVERAKAAGADAVILSVHFGNEYTYTPSGLQKQTVDAMRECGALAVIGHHPHVLQEMVVDPDGMFFAAYSLGNVVTVTSTKQRQFAALLKLTVKKDPMDGSVTISKLSYIPTWTRMLTGSDGKKHLRVYDIRQALDACRNGTDPEIPKGCLNELEKGFDWIKDMLGDQYIDTESGIVQQSK